MYKYIVQFHRKSTYFISTYFITNNIAQLRRFKVDMVYTKHFTVHSYGNNDANTANDKTLVVFYFILNVKFILF